MGAGSKGGLGSPRPSQACTSCLSLLPCSMWESWFLAALLPQLAGMVKQPPLWMSTQVSRVSILWLGSTGPEG